MIPALACLDQHERKTLHGFCTTAVTRNNHNVPTHSVPSCQSLACSRSSASGSEGGWEPAGSFASRAARRASFCSFFCALFTCGRIPCT